MLCSVSWLLLFARRRRILIGIYGRSRLIAIRQARDAGNTRTRAPLSGCHGVRRVRLTTTITINDSGSGPVLLRPSSIVILVVVAYRFPEGSVHDCSDDYDRRFEGDQRPVNPPHMCLEPVVLDRNPSPDQRPRITAETAGSRRLGRSSSTVSADAHDTSRWRIGAPSQLPRASLDGPAFAQVGYGAASQPAAGDVRRSAWATCRESPPWPGTFRGRKGSTHSARWPRYAARSSAGLPH